MALELRWLRSFVTIAEERHLSRAARRLNLAQPALTAQLQQLEEAVGATLVERTNRVSGLTPAGVALLPEARALVERAAALPALATRAQNGQSGRLRVGVIPPAATAGVAETFRLLRADFPGIEVSLRRGNQDALIAALTAGDLDLVLGRPEHPPARSGLRERMLFSEDQGILLREDDPRAKSDPVPLARLAGTPLLLLRDNLHFGQLLLDLASRHGVALVPQRTADDFPMLFWMVQAGMGVAPCSLRLSETLQRGLTVRSLRPAPPRLQVNAIWRGPETPPPAARWLERAAALRG